MPPKKKLKSGDAHEGKDAEGEGISDSTSGVEKADAAAPASAGAVEKVRVADAPEVVTAPVGEDTAEKAEEMQVDEPSGPKELEADAPEDGRPRVEDPTAFLAQDTTLNLMPASVGGMLMALREGGLQYLFAGARANIGIKSGRYMFEARIVEYTTAPEIHGAHTRTPVPRSFLRLGFSTAATLPIIGDSEDSICFDSDGNLLFNRKRTPVSQKFGCEHTVAVMLNLDEASPNAHTISFFKDGVRVAQPQPLPECLRDKPLFPTVTFKSMTVHVNFGPTTYVNLPFKCRMVQDAAEADVVRTTSAPPKDGKYEVLFPVCMPDEGTFDWLDWFLEKNPQYSELSDRRVVDWAVRSGLFRAKANSPKNSLDRPDLNFGIPFIDDGGVKKLLTTIAPVQQRHFLLMDVQGNLTKEDRLERLAHFSLPHLRRVAMVMMGEPSLEFKQRARTLLLKDKQAKLEKEMKEQKIERFRKKLTDFRKRQGEKARERMARIKKKMDKDKKRKLEDMQPAKDKDEGAAKDKEAGAGAAAEEKLQAEEKGQAEEKKDASDEEDEDEEVEKEPRLEDEEDEEVPPVELTPEEERSWFRKPGAVPDLSSFALNTSISRFSMPREEEGFDEVRYLWQQASEAEGYMKKWVLERKLTTRVEDLQPSEWFKVKWQKWLRDYQSWQAKNTQFKNPKKRTAKFAAKAATSSGQEGAKTDEEKKTPKPQNGEPEPEQEKSSKEEEDQDPMRILETEMELYTFDVFGVEDICRVDDSGTPLFANFEFEDWALLSLRFELHLLVHAFHHDCADPERRGIPPEHLGFYYSKYFKKVLSPKNFGVENVIDVIEMISDTVLISVRRRVVESLLAEDLESNDIFVKLAEDSRRDRQRRLDAGEATARLRFPTRPAEAARRPVTPAPSIPAPLLPGMVVAPGLVSTGVVVTGVVPPGALYQPAPRLPGALGSVQVRIPAGRVGQQQHWYAPRATDLNTAKMHAPRWPWLQQWWHGGR